MPTQDEPSGYSSRFQIGASFFSASIACRHASNASARCGAAAAITTEISPGSSAPVRWWMAMRAAHLSLACAAICSKMRTAISGYASYSSRTTRLPWFVARTVPTKLTTAPQSAPATSRNGTSGASTAGPMRWGPAPPETGGISATSLPSRSLRSGAANSWSTARRSLCATARTVDECLALLKGASLRPESIAEEMECAGVLRLQPARVQAARDILAKLQTAAVAQTAGLGGPDARALAAEISALPEMLALAMVHAAGRAARQEVLHELATSPSRTLAKESKRELQKLKQRGVQVQEIPPQGEPVLKPLPEGEAPSCYASSIAAYGERAVWWTRPARQGVEVVQVIISDLKGILAVDALALSRRSWREFVKRLPRQSVVATAEIPKDHARQLIADAEAAG